jgi:hypothetical protein
LQAEQALPHRRGSAACPVISAETESRIIHLSATAVALRATIEPRRCGSNG